MRWRAQIPLLPQSEEWAAELLQDSQRRVRVGRDAPPTILLLTFLNTANTLNAVDISRDASLLAGGLFPILPRSIQEVLPNSKDELRDPGDLRRSTPSPLNLLGVSKTRPVGRE